MTYLYGDALNGSSDRPIRRMWRACRGCEGLGRGDVLPAATAARALRRVVKRGERRAQRGDARVGCRRGGSQVRERGLSEPQEGAPVRASSTLPVIRGTRRDLQSTLRVSGCVLYATVLERRESETVCGRCGT